jgi:hypothetical protein
MSTEQGMGTITGLLGTIVDDTMHFVDDLLGRVKEAEIDTRSAVTNLVDVSGNERQADDMAAFQKTLAELQSKVEQLNALKAKAN